MAFARTLGLLALANIALASPIAQGLDMGFVEVQPPAPTPSIAIGQTEQVVTVNQASLIASVVKAVTASPLATIAAAAKIKHRDAVVNAVCVGGTAQPAGAGPVTTPDTADAFLNNPYYNQQATAPVSHAPTGYTQVYGGQTASSITYGYLGYNTVSSYDPSVCAARCDAIYGCQSFNIYFERDPSVDPGTGVGCQDPPSTTNIKCAYWGSPLYASSLTNYGQYRANFHVVISGSNGYSKTTVPNPAGYTPPTYLGDATINAPTQCNSYLGVKYFNTGAFDVNLCAVACTAQTTYNLAHPPATGAAQTCNFFATYLLYKNGVAQGQYCALYANTWDISYATNRGQYDGAGNHYTIGSSYISSNAANPNPTTCH